MRDDQIREILRNANPWWRAVVTKGDPRAWTVSHRLFRELGRYDLGYRSDVLADIVQAPVSDALVVLTGPRRVGKSVALLEAASSLCGRRDIDPRQIIHVPADSFSAQDLRRSFVLGREETRSVDLEQSRPRIWLLDEVSGISEWTTTLKGVRDQTPVGDDTVIATGSRWVGHEDVTANLLAGRAGHGDHRRLRHLWPMSFRDFVIAAERDVPLPPVLELWELQSSATHDFTESVAPFIDDYDFAWQEYLRCGGFPRAAYEFVTTGGISAGYARDLEAWLIADLGEDDSPDSVSNLLAGLFARATSPLNVARASSDLGYRTPGVFERRLNRLKSTFAALECPQRDSSGRRISRTQSKVYLTDPILTWLPSLLYAGAAAPDMTSLTEMVIGTHIAQAIDANEEGRWADGTTIGYARTDSGREVDFAPVPIRSASGMELSVPVEGKWVANGWRPEARVMENKYGKGILATRSIIDLSRPTWAVPAPILALFLR